MRKRTNWDELAGKIFREQQKYARRYQVAMPTNISLLWGGEHYYGVIESIVRNEKESLLGLLPENYEEMVLLSRFERASQGLIDAMRRIDTNMLEMIADDSLELVPQGTVVRRQGNRIIDLTPEQRFYVHLNWEKYNPD